MEAAANNKGSIVSVPPGNDSADSPPPTGFVARLGGVSLLDLIHFECLRQGQRILRVSSRGQSGYLYFRDGALVHAATAVSAGVDAVREMFTWTSGSVESGTGGWPVRESITRNTDDLLTELVGPQAARPRGREVASHAPTPKSGAPDGTVILGPTGELVSGGSVPGLPEVAAYAAQMAEMIGGFLGFDRFCALEAQLGGENLLVGRDKEGKLVARREREPERLADLRDEVLP
jgi:Domain of unknown function (DUF4388)